MAVGLVRPITRSQAVGYDQVVPNGRGVTALAEVNGRGAYARRYEHARRLLENAAPRRARAGGKKMATKKKAPGSKAAFMATQKRKGASPAQAEARWNFRVMNLGRRGVVGKKASARQRHGTRAAHEATSRDLAR